MGKGGNIVHQYFKQQFEGFCILVKVNPILFNGTEITRYKDGKIEIRNLEFDQDIFEDLAADGFEQTSALEFNLYLSGIA